MTSPLLRPGVNQAPSYVTPREHLTQLFTPFTWTHFLSTIHLAFRRLHWFLLSLFALLLSPYCLLTQVFCLDSLRDCGFGACGSQIYTSCRTPECLWDMALLMSNG